MLKLVMQQVQPKRHRTDSHELSQRSLPLVGHVSFGTDAFSQSLSRLRRSAKRFGIRDVRIYQPDHRVLRTATEENPEIMRLPRGAGYWMWKPYILLDAMDSVAEGTIIVYTDAGLRYIGNPSPIVGLAETRDVVLFRNPARGLQRNWTKRDCFVLMQADTPEHWDAEQVDASIQIYRAGAKARSFLMELQNAMRDPRVLCDGPNTCGLANFEGFRDHRHDQSVLTILATKHRVEIFPSPKVIVRKRPAEGADTSPRIGRHRRQKIFEHHRRRNEPLLKFVLRLAQDSLGT
jgi:hypothetical protein